MSLPLRSKLTNCAASHEARRRNVPPQTSHARELVSPVLQREPKRWLGARGFQRSGTIYWYVRLSASNCGSHHVGKDLQGIAEHITPLRIAEILSKKSGKTVRSTPMTVEEFHSDATSENPHLRNHYAVKKWFIEYWYVCYR